MHNLSTMFRYLTVLAVAAGSASAEISFNQDIRPILSKKCIACHGPDGEKRDGNLRLDVPDGKYGAHRIYDGSQAIKPGDLEGSEVWRRIISDDANDMMPPPTSHFKTLDEKERELVRQWILEGAEYEDFWAFVPPRQAEVPITQKQDWAADPIDSFILSKLESEGLEPSPEADRRTLIRRLTLDLTGLPPTLADIDAFLSDESANAYEKVVDRLLRSPHYGEHMARYWLDLVRFADTNGMHHDHYREMTPYRDWVIRSFNENLPFDDFTRYQIAGDLFEKPTHDQLIASGFNRLHLIIDVGTALPEESHFKNVVDRVSSVGTAFMGLTMQCAVCHDHKYDPITQKDFFSMFAFFNNFDGTPETGRRNTFDFKRGLQKPYLELPSEEQKAALAEIQSELAQLESNLRAAKESDELKKQVKAKQRERDNLLLDIPATLIMRERKDIRPAHIAIRGSYDAPGEVVPRDTPGFLPPLSKEGEIASRMDLANWLTSSENPLTARVTVNRLWQQIFGTGLVKTSEDFGAQGEWPSHPKLLDHLALQFEQSGWDVKALIRSFVMTKTYRQSSKATAEQFNNDKDNRMLARSSRYRYDAEVIRDQILTISGRLSTTMFGKSVKPPQPDGLWEIVSMPLSYPRTYKVDEGEGSRRRSLYTFWKRSFAPPQLSIFDAPSRESCISRRERTNTPLQALVLMNEQQYFEAAKQATFELLQSSETDDARRVSTLYETVTSHLPGESTLSHLMSGLEGFREHFAENPDAAKELAAAYSSTGEEQIDFAAWTMVVHTLLNLDTTKTRE